MYSGIRLSDFLQKAAFALLCIYMASMSLCYVSPVLMRAHSLSLYSFVILSAASFVLRGRVIFTGYLKMYTAFAVLSLISCLYSINFKGSFSSFYGVFVCFVVCFCATGIVYSEEQLRTLFKVFSIASFLLMVVLIARGDIDLSGNWVYGERFGGELTGNANKFSIIYMFGASFSAYLIAYGSGGWKKALYIVAFASQILALIVAGGRKYILVTALVLWLIYLFKTDKKNRRHYFKYTAIGVAVFILFAWAFLNVPFMYYSIGHRFEAIFSETLDDVSVIRRGIMIREGIQGWLERPIFGHGVDSFKYRSQFGVYSHNNYVELLFNMGLIGAVLYYGYSLLLAVKLFKSKNTDSVKWLLLMLTVAIFFYDYGAISYNIVIQQMFIALCSRFLTFKETESGEEKVMRKTKNAKFIGDIRNSAAARQMKRGNAVSLSADGVE